MITGSIVALVTPMHPDGAIDWSAFARLIEYHIEKFAVAGFRTLVINHAHLGEQIEEEQQRGGGDTAGQE